MFRSLLELFEKFGGRRKSLSTGNRPWEKVQSVVLGAGMPISYDAKRWVTFSVRQKAVARVAGLPSFFYSLGFWCSRSTHSSTLLEKTGKGVSELRET